ASSRLASSSIACLSTTAPYRRRSSLRIWQAIWKALWNDVEADTRLKKRIVRALIREVIVDVDATAGEVILIIHWKGGVHSELRLPRRRRGQSSAHTSKQALEAIRVLAQIHSDDMIAALLNRNALRTGRGNRWTRERVTSLRTHQGIPCYCAERRSTE